MKHFLLILILIVTSACFTEVKLPEQKQYYPQKRPVKVSKPLVEMPCFSVPVDSNVKMIYEVSSGSRINGYFRQTYVYTFSHEMKFYIKDSDADAKLLKKTWVYGENKTNISQLFENYKFRNFPALLPKTNKLRWPYKGMSVAYRNSPTDKFYKVYADLTADNKYYSAEFLDFQRELNIIVNNIFSE